MIKIILADDHLVVRNGLKMLIDAQIEMQIIAEANNGLEVMEQLEKGLKPDIILTDISMPIMDGIALTEKLHMEYPDIKVILLSMIDNSDFLFQGFERGVKGYLVKNVSYEELLFAIKHVRQGGKYLCEDLAMLLIEKSSSEWRYENDQQERDLGVDFSERELEVLQLISDGFTNYEIAEKLFLSKRTVEGHRQNLIDKTGMRNSASLIKLAVKHKLVH